MTTPNVRLLRTWSPSCSCCVPVYRWQVVDASDTLLSGTVGKVLLESQEPQEIQDFLTKEFGVKFR